MKTFALSVLATAALVACGGGGGTTAESPSTSSASTTAVGTVLSGTAAGGAPVVGTVTVKDSLGRTEVTPINADGTYQINVAHLTGPFMLRASGVVGGASVNYYSAATTADLDKTINVTPFTTLIISNIAARLADTYFESGTFSTAITAQALDAAKSSLQQKLAPALQALGLSGSIDLLRESFKADHSGLDLALDLIKVSINPDTNVATLTHAVSKATIGEDNLNSSTDDTSAVTLSDADKTALSSAKTDVQQLQAVLTQLTGLFAGTALPSISQLSTSGVFDTVNFSMGGANFDQFAGDVSMEENLMGVKVVSSDLVFTGTNTAIAKLIWKLKDGTAEKIDFTLARANAGSAWKITGDGRIADMHVRPLVTRVENFGRDIAPTFTSGVEMFADVDYHNLNNENAMVTSAIMTGPGIVPLPGQQGIVFNAKVGLHYLGLAEKTATPGVLTTSNSNLVPQCLGARVDNCVDYSKVADNAVYNVKFYAGTIALNGEGYDFTLAKKPLSASTGEGSGELKTEMFPTITSATIDGADVTALAQFQVNKNVSVAWTMPSTLVPYWISLRFIPNMSSPGIEVGGELNANSPANKTIALGSAPSGATFAHFWLTGTDVYGRAFVMNRRYHTPMN